MKHIKKFNENISNANKFLSKDDIYEVNDMLLDIKDEGFLYDVEYYVDNSDVITRNSGDWVDSTKTDIELNNICSIPSLKIENFIFKSPFTVSLIQLKKNASISQALVNVCV